MLLNASPILLRIIHSDLTFLVSLIFFPRDVLVQSSLPRMTPLKAPFRSSRFPYCQSRGFRGRYCIRESLPRSLSGLGRLLMSSQVGEGLECRYAAW
jgi:hypothetical protein